MPRPNTAAASIGPTSRTCHAAPANPGTRPHVLTDPNQQVARDVSGIGTGDPSSDRHGYTVNLVRGEGACARRLLVKTPKQQRLPAPTNACRCEQRRVCTHIYNLYLLLEPCFGKLVIRLAHLTLSMSIGQRDDGTREGASGIAAPASIRSRLDLSSFIELVCALLTAGSRRERRV